VTGVSGSASPLWLMIFSKRVSLLEKDILKEKVGTHRSITGGWLIDRVEHVDQSPIGRSSRSNPVTYLKIF